MVRISVERDVASRLAAYLLTGNVESERTSHWAHYGSRNWVRADPPASTVTFEAGAGFDSSFERNFRRRRLRELAGDAWRSLSGRDDDERFRQAFGSLWPSSQANFDATTEVLRPPLTAHKILAAHYLKLLSPAIKNARPRHQYLEIGAGSGYLAALVHHACESSVTIVDLPEILVFSFLYLHSRFPDVAYRLPNEPRQASRESNAPLFQFLTPGQTSEIPDSSVDLAVNTASFGEMLPGEIARYFRLLRRALRPDGFFFTANRQEKWMDLASAAQVRGKPSAQIPVRFGDYPWSPSDRDVLFEESAFHAEVQPQHPVLIRLCHLARD